MAQNGNDFRWDWDVFLRSEADPKLLARASPRDSYSKLS